MPATGKITFMWKDGDSRTGSCPALLHVDEGGEGYIVVGKNTGSSVRAQIPEISDKETAVFVPPNLPDRLNRT